MKIDVKRLRDLIASRRKALGGDTYAHAKPGNSSRRETKIKITLTELETLLDAYELP